MYRYLSRLADTLLSRQDITVEHLEFDRPSPQQGQIAGRLRFFDGSLLVFAELSIKVGSSIQKLEYRYHYQKADSTLVFRYDCSGHYPHLSTHPHHKHMGTQVIPATPPDLAEVLREIDTFIYP
jgi:hypothetical protein